MVQRQVRSRARKRAYPILVRIRFSDVELDCNSRRLHRAGEPVHLTTKAFDLLVLLVQRRPAVLSKSDIREHLWPQTHVSDTNLPALVTEIRSAIGDDAKAGKFVRTIHGVGYAFNVLVSDIAAAPEVAAWLVGPTSRTGVPSGQSVIGREGDDVLALDAPTISRRHARLEVSGGTARVEDLDSKNGTFVNEVRVASAQALNEGDTLRVGSVVFTFRFARPETSTQTM